MAPQTLREQLHERCAALFGRTMPASHVFGSDMFTLLAQVKASSRLNRRHARTERFTLCPGFGRANSSGKPIGIQPHPRSPIQPTVCRRRC